MEDILKLATNLAGGIIGGGLLRKVIGKKKKKTQQVARPATRDDVADRIQRESILRQRRGSAADLITGSEGAEAAPTGIVSLLGN